MPCAILLNAFTIIPFLPLKNKNSWTPWWPVVRTLVIGQIWGHLNATTEPYHTILPAGYTASLVVSSPCSWSLQNTPVLFIHSKQMRSDAGDTNVSHEQNQAKTMSWKAWKKKKKKKPQQRSVLITNNTLFFVHPTWIKILEMVWYVTEES